MAFIPENFQRLSMDIQDPNGGAIRLFGYNTTTDTLATVAASGYFNYFCNSNRGMYNSLLVGDFIMVSATDGANILKVTALAPNITTADFLTGTVDTADLADGAVTNAKVNAAAAIAFSKLAALTSGNILVGNGSNVATSVAMSGAMTLSNAGVATLSPTLMRYTVVTVSAAEILAMYATPKQLVAAGGANTLHRVHDVVLEVDYGTTQFASGGAIAVQYDSTANGAGTAASATLAAATLNGYTADSTVGLAGNVATASSSTTVNKGLYLSNATGAFTTGDSTVYVHIWYSTVPTTV